MKDSKLEKVLKYGVKKMNENEDLLRFFREKTEGEERTSVFKIITNTGDVVTGGFAWNGSEFIYVDENTKIDNPTVVFKTTENIVWSLILGKIALESAVYIGDVQVEGKYWLRDVALFTRAFKEFNNVFQNMF